MCVIRTAASQKNIVEGESLVSQIEERVGLPIKNNFIFFYNLYEPHPDTLEATHNKDNRWSG